MKIARLAAIAAAGGLLAATPAAAAAKAPPCTSTHWIGAWASSPSDSSSAGGALDYVDASGNSKPMIDNETVRAALTPTYGGSTVRIRLSNRYADAAVTCAQTTIALKGEGAALAGAAVPVRFSGSRSVTLGAGKAVISDPVHFSFAAGQTLAVSIHVSSNPGFADEHYTARQTSYLSPPGTGDQTTDTSGSVFVQKTTTRPYVVGLDVVAPASAGAVVAFGDSITDGFQAGPAGAPEDASTIDADGRWPDDLSRRLRAAHVPLSVLNAGISGNLVLKEGGFDTFGAPALRRMNADVLAMSGVTTVIWLEGINDLPGGTTAAQLEAGWKQGIARMHAAGLRVLMATLTPSGSASGAYSGYAAAAVNQVRMQANAWLRAHNPADGLIDFDAAVRDPANPSQISPLYNGGDGLHFNLAGYQKMADTVKLATLRRASCAASVTRPRRPARRRHVARSHRRPRATRRSARRAQAAG